MGITSPVYICPKCGTRTSLTSCLPCGGLKLDDEHREARPKRNHRQPWSGTVDVLYHGQSLFVKTFCKLCSKTAEMADGKVYVTARARLYTVCPSCSRNLIQCPSCKVFSSTTTEKPSPFDELVMTLLEHCDNCGAML